jgi:hypothetical protein
VDPGCLRTGFLWDNTLSNKMVNGIKNRGISEERLEELGYG